MQIVTANYIDRYAPAKWLVGNRENTKREAAYFVATGHGAFLRGGPGEAGYGCNTVAAVTEVDDYYVDEDLEQDKEQIAKYLENTQRLYFDGKYFYADETFLQRVLFFKRLVLHDHIYAEL